VVEDLPSKLEALRSNSSLKKKQKDFLQFLEKVSLRYFLKSKISTIFKNTFSNSIIMLYYFQENLFKILLFSSVANFISAKESLTILLLRFLSTLQNVCGGLSPLLGIIIHMSVTASVF
jgi:hypothetical protein